MDLPVTIVSGYLGSGKTTFINERLNDANGVRYGVLVNDFGQLNIDAALIDASDGLTVALENGCVCCSLEGGLEQASQQLLSIADQIDWVLLEASGVADPDRLQARVKSWPGFQHDETLTLVDVTRVQKLIQDKFVGGHVRKQLHDAETLIVTKKDLVEADDLLQFEKWLRCFLQSATVITEEVPAFCSETIVFDKPLDRNVLTSWLSQLDCSTLRLKGFLNISGEERTQLLQWVDKRWSLTPAPEGAETLGLVRITVAGAAPLKLPQDA